MLLTLAPLGLVAHAQPNTNNAPKADNPANRAPRGLRDPNMAPADLMKLLIKRQFSQLGADAAMQDILVAFVQGETKARQDLAKQGQPLQQALRAAALTDTQVTALLNSYQVALEDEKTRHVKAVADLQKAIDFKKYPKIEAALTLSGMIGDGPTLNIGGGLGRALAGGMGGRGQNGLGGGRNNRRATPANPPARAA